jgi:hypothetical protein
VATPYAPFYVGCFAFVTCQVIEAGDTPDAAYERRCITDDDPFGFETWCDFDAARANADALYMDPQTEVCCTTYCGEGYPVIFGLCPRCNDGLTHDGIPSTAFAYNPATGLCEYDGSPCEGTICVLTLDRCTGAAVATVNIMPDGVSCGFTDASGELCCTVACGTHTLAANSAMFVGVSGLDDFTIHFDGEIVYRTIYMDQIGVPCDVVGCVAPEYYCALTGTCIEIPPPLCATELDCIWNFRNCTWECDQPQCDSGETWDWDECECQPCDFVQNLCWCETSQTCVTCTAPPCAEELRCRWSSASCEWICADPAAAVDPTDPGYCPPGEEWDWLTCGCITPPADADGVDLAVQAVGHVYRSYKTARNGTNVAVDVTRDKGVSWISLGTVATDCAQDGAPSLAINRHDELFLFYHDSLKRLRTWASYDDGETWVDRGTYSALEFEYPKVAITPDRWVMAMWETGGLGLRLLCSDDLGATWTGITQFSAPKQRASISQDRHGFTHLMFRDGYGRILHAAAADPCEDDSWTTPAQMGTLTGDTPSYAIGPTNQALLAYHSIPLSLWAWLTEEDYSTPDDAITGLSPFAVPQWLGVLVDEEDTPWVVGRLGGGGFAIDQGTGDGGLTFEPPS